MTAKEMIEKLEPVAKWLRVEGWDDDAKAVEEVITDLSTDPVATWERRARAAEAELVELNARIAKMVQETE